MKSPFPGMDPYLEDYWGDVHTSLVTYARDQLQPQLPDELWANVEEYVAVATSNGEFHSYRPDVSVMDDPLPESRSSSRPSAVAVAEPLVVARPAEPETLRMIQIVETASDRIVTSIEILSHSNKLGRGRELFVAKQDDLLHAGANLVEIDLLRRGGHALSVSLPSLPRLPLDEYIICVVRAHKPHSAELYGLSVRQPLPAFRVPLRRFDTDIHLDLQALIELAYERGSYGKRLTYRGQPDPPFSREDAEWAEGLLRAAGKR